MAETNLDLFKLQEVKDFNDEKKQLLKKADELIEECKTPIKEEPKVAVEPTPELKEESKPIKKKHEVKSRLEPEFPLEEIKPEVKEEKIITKRYQFIFQGEEMLKDISKLEEGTDTVLIKDLREGLYHLPKLVKVTKQLVGKYKATIL